MLRAPRSVNVHATADPFGDATRFDGNGKSSTCSIEKPAAAFALWAATGALRTTAKPELTTATTSVQRRRFTAGLLFSANYNCRLVRVAFRRHSLRAPVAAAQSGVHAGCRHVACRRHRVQYGAVHHRGRAVVQAAAGV